MQQNERKASRTRSPKGKSPSGRMSRWPCKDYLKGTCNNSFCEKWHAPEWLFYKTKSGCRFGEKCWYAHRQADEQPTERSKKNDDKMLEKGDWNERGPVTDQCPDRSGKPDKMSDKKLGQKSSQRRSSDARQMGCVFQDMTPPKSISRSAQTCEKPIQRVKFTKTIARHTKIRDQNPSLGYICLGKPHQRSPNAPKFEDRSQEETEWQEQGAREAAWKLAKHVLKLKEHERATFFSLSENRCLLAVEVLYTTPHIYEQMTAQIMATSLTRLSTTRWSTLTLACTWSRTTLRPEHTECRSLIHTVSHRGSSRLARVIPSMHGHLCVVWWLFSSPVSFSSLFCCSSSRLSRRPPPRSTRSSCPNTCATSAWGPWPVMTTRHPSQVMTNREMNFMDTEEFDLAATSDIYWQHTFDDTSRNDPDVDDDQLAMYLAGVVDSTGCKTKWNKSFFLGHSKLEKCSESVSCCSSTRNDLSTWGFCPN